MKLTETQIAKARQLGAAGMSQRDIAARVGCSHQTIGKYQRRGYLPVVRQRRREIHEPMLGAHLDGRFVQAGQLPL